MIDETTQQNTVENLQENTQEVSQNTAPIQLNQQKSDKEKNFTVLREKTERIERERDEALRLLQEMQAKMKQPESLDDEQLMIADSDLVEGKHLQKFYKKIQNLEKNLKEQQYQTREIAIETQLKAQYPDFDAVVNKENLESLRAQYPEIAHTLNSSSDLYNKAASAYSLIKKLGILPDQNALQNKELVQRNFSKPRPLASISPQEGDSPLSHANAFAQGLTDDLKKKLHAEMVEAMKNR